MAPRNFELALEHVLRHEGGFANHPHDPGGVTMRGVTQRVYDGYRLRRGLSRQTVRQIEAIEIVEIYKRQYWDRCGCDELPDGVDYVVFDGAVNSGPGQSLKWLQRSLNSRGAKIKVDGDIGELTLGAVEASADNVTLVREICDRRLAFLQALKTWKHFGKGWSRRVGDVKKRGAELASDAHVTPAVEVQEPQGKGSEVDLPNPKAAEEGAKGGGIGTVVVETVNQVQPYADYSDYIRYAVVALLLISAGLAIYAYWRGKKNERARDAELIIEGI